MALIKNATNFHSIKCVRTMMMTTKIIVYLSIEINKKY